MPLDEAMGSAIQLRRPVRRRAVIISGSYGAGHDAAAALIRAQLLHDHWEVDQLDVVDLFPLGLGVALRRIYLAQLKYAPHSWGGLLALLEIGRPGWGLSLGEVRGLSGRVAAQRMATALGPDPDLVISTHPFASQTLGYLRAQGMVSAPVVTYLTDPSVHPFWIHPGVDVTLALYAEAARQAGQHGAREVRLIRPPVPECAPALGTERSELRARLGLLSDERVVLVTSGSEGSGDVRATARDIRAIAGIVPVVLCGTNDRLRCDLSRERGIHALGWIDGLGDVIRGADCVVQNSGGATTIEALMLGTPLLSYRPLPGHGKASAAALAREGLAPWPRSPRALGTAIATAVHSAAAGECAHATDLWQERPSLTAALPGALPVQARVG